MSLSEIEIKACERDIAKFMEARRPPVHIRKDLDFGYRIENQSVLLFEIRPEFLAVVAQDKHACFFG